MSSPFELLGDDDERRDQRVRALVDRFYDLMDARPEARAIRAMHPTDLAHSREKLHLFLRGWLGGPQTYVERFGHPRLRARHLPFRIDDDAALQWMSCMSDALAELVPEPELREAMAGALRRMAAHMRNVEG